MPSQVTWTPAGSAALRIDQDARWTLLGMGGHGAPDTSVLTVGSPERDERLPLHAAAQPRLIALTVRIVGSTLAAYEANRAALAAAFAPWRDTGVRATPGLLTVTLADGRIRALRAYPRRGLAWTAGRQRGNATIESILLEASDPFWYDPTPQQGVATIQAPGNLRFDGATELGFPAGWGSDRPSATVQITNPGSVRAFPTFTVDGPTLNPSFRHGATGHVVAFNLTVPTGLTLRLVAGAQPDGSADGPSAVLIDDLGGQTNVLGALAAGARFWALGPGANTVIVAQTSPDAGTTIDYAFFPRDVAI